MTKEDLALRAVLKALKDRRDHCQEWQHAHEEDAVRVPHPSGAERALAEVWLQKYTEASTGYELAKRMTILFHCSRIVAAVDADTRDSRGEPVSSQPAPVEVDCAPCQGCTPTQRSACKRF